jgi:hypothetical protein
MKIIIYGPVSESRDSMLDLVSASAAQLECEKEISVSEDMQKMKELGVADSPVLTVDGKPVLSGQGHTLQAIRDALTHFLPKDNQEKCNKCAHCHHH